MAQTQAPDSGLRVPLAAAVWTAPTTVYKYDTSAGFGVFAGTKDAAIYAIEDGLFMLLKDGSWVLKKDVIAQGRAVGTREWVGVSTMNAADGVKNNMVVKAGQLLGVAKEDFALTLSQSINNVTQTLDPVPYLIMAQAKFVAIPREPQARQRPEQQPHTTTITTQTKTPTGEITTTQTSEVAAPKERTFKPGHVVAVGLGGIFLGGLVAYNMKRR